MRRLPVELRQLAAAYPHRLGFEQRTKHVAVLMDGRRIAVMSQNKLSTNTYTQANCLARIKRALKEEH